MIASEILEHVPDDDGAIAELIRVLKPGGTLAVTVPRWLPEKICWLLSDDYHANEGGHIRIYRADELRAKLTRGGLTFTHSHHAHASAFAVSGGSNVLWAWRNRTTQRSRRITSCWCGT